MSASKYKFISPGIFVSEIDNTGREATPADVGPALIGRSEKGPMLKPTRVDSYFDFVNTFGNPIPGGKGGDVARNGNYSSPTYASYAAQAWFRNNAPVVFVRLGGQAHEQADTATAGALAGWKTEDTVAGTGVTDNGGAYGLFVSDAPTQTIETATVTVADLSVAHNENFTLTNGVTTRTFLSGASNSTVDSTAATAVLTFKGTEASNDLVAKNISTVVSLTSIATSSYATNVVTITPTGKVISPLAYKASNGTGSADLVLRIDGDILPVGHTGSLTASYGAVDNGTLAAVWYIDQSASIALSGTSGIDGAVTKGTSIYVDAVGDKRFKVQISASNEGVVMDSAFDFTSTSDQYIRKVFNTNPILTNDAATDSSSDSFQRYWLGESYEGAVNEALTAGGDHIGAIFPLMDGTNVAAIVQKDYQPAKTGYFIAQDTSTGTGTGSFDARNQQKLFRLCAHNNGDWVSKNLKVSIKDIRAARNNEDFGSFSVVLRKMSDTDNRVESIEQFNNCNLNPNSENFIARKIGDRYETWDDAERRYREFGDYPSMSRYVYVDMPDAVKLGNTESRFLPFGVIGPPRFDTFSDLTASAQKDTMVSGNLDDYGATVTGFVSGSTNGSIGFDFPKLRLRVSASEGSPVDPLSVYWGVDTTFDSMKFDKSTLDHLKAKPTGIDSFVANTTEKTTADFYFTLDDMCFTGAASEKRFVYLSGSRQMDSVDDNAARNSLGYVRGTGSYTEVLNSDLDRFTTTFHGGFDGLDIKESEPMRLANVGASDVTENYAYNSIQVAIDSLRDPEIVEYNLAAMPGITNSTLNETLFTMCEARGDALAVIDLPGGYTPQYEDTSSADDRKGDVQSTIDLLNNRDINSSYGCAYYPWVQLRDQNTGQAIWAPPSVAAIGAMSYGQKSSELWFAPAGFTRGGLSGGKAGLPIVSVRERLTSKQRDKLYEANINPIAQFPAEGIVIFGQKTLQTSASALDRINIRRLMIFLKRQVSRFASTILFDQNVRVTWNRFKGQVEPFLRGVQAGLGISAFKLVLDETTTTPDLVDRNVVYAKIYIKPTRAIEFIAIDFILTDNGAAFED